MDFELKYYLLFEITGKCNIKCKYCYNSGLNDNVVSTEELQSNKIISVAKDAVEKHNCKKVVFSGGEPFLRKDIFEIINEISVPIVIITNGTILNDKILEELKKLNHKHSLQEIRVSYDGIRGQEILRDKKSAKAVWSNIIKLHQAGLPVMVNTMLTEFNLEDLPDLYKTIVLQRGIPWLLDYPFNNGRWIDEHDSFEVKNKNRMFDILQIIIEDYINNRRQKDEKKIEIANYFSTNVILGGFYEIDSNAHPCAYSFGAMTIKPNGNIGFCPTLDWVFGNVNDDKIENISSNKNYKKWLSIKTNDIVRCKNCKYFRICGTGCRADAYYLTGDLYERDFNACMFISNFHQRIVPLLKPEQQEEFDNLLNINGFTPNY